MSSNERDTHFSGFANLLYADLVKLFTAMLSCRVLGQDDNAAYTEQAIKEVLAQRAYDLACHALEEVNANVLHYRGVETAILGIPDLTEWPTPQTSVPQDHAPD